MQTQTLTTRQSALRAISAAIVESVKECPMGAPGGILYAAMMAHGCSFNQFTSIMASIVKAGLLRKSGDLYFYVERA